MKISSVRYIDNPAEKKPEGYYLRVNDIRLALGLPFTKLDEIIKGEDKKIPTRYIECVIRMALCCHVSCDYLFGLTDNTMPYSKSASVPIGLDTTRVKELRKERKVTIKTLANVIEAAQTTYWQKEADNTRFAFTMYDIVALATFFHTSTDYLLHLTDEVMPYKEGCHDFVPLSAETKLRIQNALGLAPTLPIESENYCLTHFRIKEIRLRRRLSVQEVADTIGVAHATYEKYEAKPSIIPIYKLIRLADYFGVSLDYLVGRTNNTHWDKGMAYYNGQ